MHVNNSATFYPSVLVPLTQKSWTLQYMWKYLWKNVSQQQAYHNPGQLHGELWSINGIPESSAFIPLPQTTSG
jgi:hypothetical protein